MSDRYAVIGNPVAHSKSPQIHAAFAQQTGQDILYEKLLAPLDGFALTLREFRQQGGRGSNVTVPFKLEAFELAHESSDRARAASAANTLLFREQIIFADNTDGAGLIQDLTVNLAVTLLGQRILLLGAGGAAQGVILPLLLQRPSQLLVVNRSAARAARLVNAFSPLTNLAHTQFAASGFDDVAGRSFDLVVNATSSSLTDDLPPLPTGLFRRGALAYDMMYGKGFSPFLRFAQEHGAARVADGLGMLVEQAAESFFLWRAVRPLTQPVITALRTL